MGPLITIQFSDSWMGTTGSWPNKLSDYPVSLGGPTSSKPLDKQ
jgi:hypothetical protein